MSSRTSAATRATTAGSASSPPFMDETTSAIHSPLWRNSASPKPRVVPAGVPSRTPFDRDKLERSLAVALRKRPVQPEQIEQLVSRITRQLESLGETEIPSSTVGDFIMKALKGVDEVAYVRYASVYKDFRHTGDFAKFLGDEGFDEPSGKV